MDKEKNLSIVNQGLDEANNQQKSIGREIDTQNKQLDKNIVKADDVNTQMDKTNKKLLKLIGMVKNSNIGALILIFTIEICLGSILAIKWKP